MAHASLINPHALDDGLAYEVQTWPFDAEPFPGPDGRSWASFRLADDGAEFEWRTRADRVLDAARALDGGAELKKLLRDREVRAYVERMSDVFDPDAYDEEDMPPEDRLGFAAWAIRGVTWEDLVEPEGPRSAYGIEDDVFLAEGAAALELPRWARRVRAMGGGPGSAYDAALIVLGTGRALEELATWLDKRARGVR